MKNFYYQVDIIKNPDIDVKQRDELLHAMINGCGGLNIFLDYEGRDKNYDGGSLFRDIWHAKYFAIVSIRETLASKSEIKKLKNLSAKIDMFENDEGPILSVHDLDSLLQIDQ